MFFIKESLKENSHLIGARSIATAIAFCLMSTSVLHAEDKERKDLLYRYKGANGELVIDDYIPPEFVGKGYSILSKNGLLIEKVAPEMSAEERAKLGDKAKAEEERKEQARKDAWLLERYSDEGDAILARNRQLGAIDTLIVVAQSKINRLKQDEARELEFAASAERRGKEITQDTLDRLESIRSQIRALEQQIENQNTEKDTLTKKFDGIIVRLKDIEQRRAEAKAK